MPISTINSRSIADGTIIATDILDGTISSSKLVSANIAGDRLLANTLSNTVFQTGSVENYVRGANLDFGMRNRIINGAMVIDQRNAGASFTPTAGSYSLDRWQFSLTQSSKFTTQQNAGSVTSPAGFRNYLGITSSSSYSVTSSDFFSLNQAIEGFNVADLGFGTANARPITISFWVRSSLTGTFAGVIGNGDNNRSYPFTFTINSANTWEYETITIPGDTSGTWLTTNGIGMYLRINLGTGSTNSGTAGAWVGGGLITSVTGAVSLVGTNGATLYITGVQLEEGSVATAFEYRQTGTELSLCQRYFEAVVAAGNNSGICSISSDSTTTGRAVYAFKTTKRVAPSVTFTAATNFLYQGSNINAALSAITLVNASIQTIMFDVTSPTHIQWATANILENVSAGTVLFAISAEL